MNRKDILDIIGTLALVAMLAAFIYVAYWYGVKQGCDKLDCHTTTQYRLI